MFVVLRPVLVTLNAAARHVAGLWSPRRLAERTILRSKTWPSDGAIRQAFLAAASVAVVALLAATALSPSRMVWSIGAGALRMVWS
jgi:hypothetical protein